MLRVDGGLDQGVLCTHTRMHKIADVKRGGGV